MIHTEKNSRIPATFIILWPLLFYHTIFWLIWQIFRRNRAQTQDVSLHIISLVQLLPSVHNQTRQLRWARSFPADNPSPTSSSSESANSAETTRRIKKLRGLSGRRNDATPLDDTLRRVVRPALCPTSLPGPNGPPSNYVCIMPPLWSDNVAGILQY